MLPPPTPQKRKVSRREFTRHFAAWSQAVLEAETIHEASLAAEVAGSLQQKGQQHVGVANPVTVVTATSATVNIRPAGNNPTANGDHLPTLHAIGGERSIGARLQEERVGAFVHRRVREILRAGTRETGCAAPLDGEQGEGGGVSGEGSIDEGILGYLMRKQCTMEGCDDLNAVSIAGYAMYEELEGGDVRIPGGFSRVVDALAGKVSRLICRCGQNIGEVFCC